MVIHLDHTERENDNADVSKLDLSNLGLSPSFLSDPSLFSSSGVSGRFGRDYVVDGGVGDAVDEDGDPKKVNLSKKNPQTSASPCSHQPLDFSQQVVPWV